MEIISFVMMCIGLLSFAAGVFALERARKFLLEQDSRMEKLESEVGKHRSGTLHVCSYLTNFSIEVENIRKTLFSVREKVDPFVPPRPVKDESEKSFFDPIGMKIEKFVQM